MNKTIFSSLLTGFMVIVLSGCSSCLEQPRVADASRRFAVMVHTAEDAASCVGCHEASRPRPALVPAPVSSSGTRPPLLSLPHGSGSDCAKCHIAGGGWNNFSPYSHQPPTATCSQCHEPGRPLPVAGLSHGDGKDCIECHQSGISWKNLVLYSHVPMPLSCQNCHETNRPAVFNQPPPLSNTVAGHFDTKDCYSCHVGKTSTSGTAADRPFQFVHQDAKQNMISTCLPCHESKRPTPTHYAGQDCVSCHLDPEKPWVASIASPHPLNQPAPLSCTGCHESARPTVTTYPSPGSTVAGHFSGQDCINCHEPKTSALLTFKFNHAPKGNVVDRCLPCHEAKRPTRTHYAGQDCVTCHSNPSQTWASPTISPHPLNNPMPATCQNCHQPDRPTTVQYPAPGPQVAGHFGTKDCNSCHLPRTATVTTFAFNHSPKGTPLSSCLPCHEAKRPTATHYTGQDCAQCHVDFTKPWAGATVTPHPANTPALLSCNGCHNSDRPTNVQYPAPGPLVAGHFGTQDCYQCHNPKTSALLIFKYNHLANGNIRTTCLPCHTAKRPTTVIQRFSHTTAGMGDCIGCHKQPGVAWTGGIYTHATTLTTCIPCHQGGAPTTVVPNTRDGFVHNATFMNGSTDCTGCHTQVKANIGVSWTKGFYNHTPVPTTCSPCHDTKEHKSGQLCTNCHKVGTHVRWPQPSATGNYGGSWGSP